MSKSSPSASSPSSSSSSQTNPTFDQRFATAFANFCFENFGHDPEVLKKSLLIAPLRTEVSLDGLNLTPLPYTAEAPSLVWGSLKSVCKNAEMPDPKADQVIMDLYFRNLDAIKEKLSARIASEGQNDDQKKAVNEAFEILQKVKSHNPQISVGKILYDEKACMIKLHTGGHYYCGEIKYNPDAEIKEIMEGKGALIYANGLKYEGSWLNGKQHGEGVGIVPDRHRYEGGWANNQFHGRGVLTSADGSRHEGEWKDGKQHGRGIITFANGLKYEGSWLNGKQHGEGVGIVPDSHRYEGGWANNQFHGRGVLTSADGSRHEGSWLNGKQHGEGVEILANGARYKGSWLNGEKHGEGVITYIDGSKYEGGWANNKFHGRGVLTSANGLRYETSDGEIVNDMATGDRGAGALEIENNEVRNPQPTQQVTTRSNEENIVDQGNADETNPSTAISPSPTIQNPAAPIRLQPTSCCVIS